MKPQVAKILRVKSSGGLVGLLLEDELPKADVLPVAGARTAWWFGDWRPTLEALCAMFGQDVTPRDVIGGRVAYTVTDYGALATLQDPDTVVDDGPEAVAR